MVTVELIGGPKDGEVMALPSLRGRIEFAVAPAIQLHFNPEGAAKPLAVRKVYYEHAGGNRYIWQDLAEAR